MINRQSDDISARTISKSKIMHWIFCKKSFKQLIFVFVYMYLYICHTGQLFFSDDQFWMTVFIMCECILLGYLWNVKQLFKYIYIYPLMQLRVKVHVELIL